MWTKLLRMVWPHLQIVCETFHFFCAVNFMNCMRNHNHLISFQPSKVQAFLDSKMHGWFGLKFFNILKKCVGRHNEIQSFHNFAQILVIFNDPGLKHFSCSTFFHTSLTFFPSHGKLKLFFQNGWNKRRGPKLFNFVLNMIDIN